MRPDLNGLWVCPSVPSDWKEFTMDKVFRGKKLHITVKNENGAECGFKEFYVNGNTFLPSRWASVKDDLWNKENWTFYESQTVLKEHKAP